jgi:hypothetical protein
VSDVLRMVLLAREGHGLAVLVLRPAALSVVAEGAGMSKATNFDMERVGSYVRGFAESAARPDASAEDRNALLAIACYLDTRRWGGHRRGARVEVRTADDRRIKGRPGNTR